MFRDTPCIQRLTHREVSGPPASIHATSHSSSVPSVVAVVLKYTNMSLTLMKTSVVLADPDQYLLPSLHKFSCRDPAACGIEWASTC